MKKPWETPSLEVLDISMTMAGPGLRYADDYNDDPDPEERDHYS
jgi:hypothetical protein